MFIKLETDYLSYYQETDKYLTILNNITTLQPKYSKMLSEVLMLRLFDLFIDTIISITTKILCGALYYDGSVPNILVKSKSKSSAITNMQSHNRRKSIRLQWTKVDYIKINIQYTTSNNEHFFNILYTYSSIIEEMR